MLLSTIVAAWKVLLLSKKLLMSDRRRRALCGKISRNIQEPVKLNRNINQSFFSQLNGACFQNNIKIKMINLGNLRAHKILHFVTDIWFHFYRWFWQTEMLTFPTNTMSFSIVNAFKTFVTGIVGLIVQCSKIWKKCKLKATDASRWSDEGRKKTLVLAFLGQHCIIFPF